MSTPSDRIWAEPLTDNEREIALRVAHAEDCETGKWLNHVLKVYDGREQANADALEAKDEALREVLLYVEQDRWAETDPPRVEAMTKIIKGGLSANPPEAS